MVLEQRGNKLLSDTDSVKSHGLVQAGQVVRWDWSIGFTVRGDKGKESDYKSLHNGVCLVHARHCTGNFMGVFFDLKNTGKI